MITSNGWPLPAGLRTDAEALLGADFSDVRLHVGPEARALGARAFALGSDVFVAPEHYAPDTPHGRHLIGHELCHVVQQRQRRVSNPFGFGVAVVHDPALEAEAEQAGQRLRGGVVPHRRGQLPIGSLRNGCPSNVLQRTPFDYEAYKLNEDITDHQKVNILNDLKIYQQYLTNSNYFETALDYLEMQLATAKAKADNTKKILSNELADKEVRCGLFNSGVNIYYQVLSDDAFKHLTEKRMQFKDVGAGFVHGEYTHRIQWYVCLFHQSRGFGDKQYIYSIELQQYNHMHMPADLFTLINTFGSSIHKRHWPSQQVSGGGYLWDTLFDRNSTDVAETDGITSPEVFNKTLFQKDKVPQQKLGFSNIGTRSERYPTLSDIVTRRYLKRTGNMPNESNQELIEYAKRKLTQEHSKYRTLVHEMQQETLEEQLKKGVLIPKD